MYYFFYPYIIPNNSDSFWWSIYCIDAFHLKKNICVIDVPEVRVECTFYTRLHKYVNTHYFMLLLLLSYEWNMQLPSRVSTKRKGSVSFTQGASSCWKRWTTWGWLKNYMHEQYAWTICMNNIMYHIPCARADIPTLSIDTKEKLVFFLSLLLRCSFLRNLFVFCCRSSQYFLIVMHGWRLRNTQFLIICAQY